MSALSTTEEFTRVSRPQGVEGFGDDLNKVMHEQSMAGNEAIQGTVAKLSFVAKQMFKLQKKKDDLLQFIIQQTEFAKIMQKAQEFLSSLKDAQQAWEKKAEEYKDDIDTLDIKLKIARIKLNMGGPYKRDEDGNFIDPDLAFIILKAIDARSDLNPEDIASMTDEQLEDLAQWAIDNPDKIKNDLSDRYKASKIVADILGEHVDEFEEIINDQNMSDEQKAEAIRDFIKRYEIEAEVVAALRKEEIDQHIVDDVLADINADNMKNKIIAEATQTVEANTSPAPVVDNAFGM